MRLGVYSDFPYWRDAEGRHSTDQAFAVLLGALAEEVDRLVLLGRLDPTPGRSHFGIPDAVSFAPLPAYASLARPREVVRGLAGAARATWRELDDLDAVWLLGPHPLAAVFAALALIRRRAVVLGVRQDFPRYTRRRHPDRPALIAAALVLEAVWRGLALVTPVVAVGPQLARAYRHAPRLLDLRISLVPRSAVATTARPLRAGDRPLRILSVGRLDAEKNPLLLADVLAALRARDPRWELVVCGEGPLRDALERRLAALGVADAADLRGHVPVDGGLAAVYETADAFLHVSWTEGVPQVLLEACAAGLTIVATDVGGVRAAVDGAAVLVAPGSAAGPADALAALAADPIRARRLAEDGLARAKDQTLEVTAERLADFLRAAAGAAGGRAPARRRLPWPPSSHWTPSAGALRRRAGRRARARPGPARAPRRAPWRRRAARSALRHRLRRPGRPRRS
jgi:glycosyltransferase involved in cell wall biosynthesis